jgi:DNA-binding CsgD family transcriptional regulator/tetratricopeptide (TPR) repeat protein
MELLERGQFLEALRECSPGRVVLVSGEAGIGKTSLLKAWCAAADRRVLWGSCDALRTPRPLGPLHDMARQAGGRLAAAMEAGNPRQVMFGAFLDELAARPGIAVVEDAHWADEATVDLLVYVTRRISQTQSLLAVTYRDDEVGPGHPLLGVLGALAADRSVLRMRLPALSVTAVAALAAANGPVGIDAGELHTRTGGNPFFVTEVLADPRPRVPETVRAAVLARVAALSAGERDVLELIAIFPGGVLVSRIEAERAAVDECVRSGMLVADGPRLAFRHELARLAIADSIPPGRKAGLHETALRSLLAEGAEPALLAFHAEEAGDSAAVLRHAPVAAARARAVAAYRQAADHYAQALRYAAILPARSRAELLEAYSEVCAGIGDPSALTASEQALACWREAGDVARQAALMARRAHFLWTSGDSAAAHETAREAVALAEQLPPGPALAAAYTWSAYLMMLARDVPGAIRVGERAAELAAEFGPPGLEARALNAIGAARWFTDPDLAEQTLMRSVRAARDAGDDAAAGSALGNLGSGAGEIRRYQAAMHWLNEAVTWCADRDLDNSREYATAWLARCLFERGAWPEADETLTRIGAQAASAPTRIVSLTTRGRLQVRRGDAGAAETLDEAWALAARTGDLQRLWPVAAGRAELAWLSGRPAAEIADLVRPTFALALRLHHPWAIGELGQWLDGGVSEAAVPYRLPPAEAARAWDELGCPFEAGLALAASSAPELLTEALRRFEQLGARPAADQVARRLRNFGVRTPRRATLSHPDGLTARQADVLALLREGLGNAAIAARLNISAKTVDHHVSAIIAKLGVRSRYEAARHVPGTGRGGEPAAQR